MSKEKGVGGLPDAGTIKPGAPGHIEDHDEMSRLMQQAADTLGIVLDPPPPPPAVVGEYGHVDAHNTLLANIEQLAEAGGGGLPGELPGIGGWSEVSAVTGVGTKYAYAANGMEWSAFEWTGDGDVTFSEEGLVDVLIVDAGTGIAANTNLGGHGGGVIRTVTRATAGDPLQIQVGVSAPNHNQQGVHWSVFGPINGVGIVTGGATGGDTTLQPIHGRGVGDRTLGLGQMHAITGTDLGYGGGGGGNFAGQQGYPIPDYDPVYGGGLNPRPNSGGGFGSETDLSKPPPNTPGADGVVVIRVPAANDKTGLSVGPFDTTTLRDKAKQKLRDKHTSPVTQEINKP